MGNHISTSTAEEIPIPILNPSSKTHELRNTLRQKFGRLYLPIVKILKCKAEKNGRRNETERALAFGVGGKEREKEVKRRANIESWG